MEADEQGNVTEATVRVVLVNAVLSPVQKESGMDKMKKYGLAQRIFRDDEIELSAEDIVLLKERIGELYAPLVVGQLFQMLEP